MLRGHLNELNDFARTSRTDLEAARTQVRQDAERLREQHAALDRAKDEHRLAVTAFRQQLIEWQGTVADMRRLLSSSENRLDAKTVAATEAASAAADATRQLAEETDRLRREREELTPAVPRWSGTSPTCASGTARSSANSRRRTRRATTRPTSSCTSQVTRRAATGRERALDSTRSLPVAARSPVSKNSNRATGNSANC